jgi:hypothetical protein
MNAGMNIQNYLEKKLHKAHAFWSFEKNTCRHLPDKELIRYVLIHLDLEDINYLFHIYSKRAIKKVWLEEVAPQGDFLRSMNLCLALVYFNVKKPVQYLKSMETRHFKKIMGYG